MSLIHSVKNILIVEDNQGDIDLLKIAFEELGYHFNLHVERDGESAINYLLKISGGGDLDALPDLIFLDLNIPRYSGYEVLEAARNLIELKTIPVLIYSSSNSPGDIRASYEKGATAHIQKSIDFEGTLQKIKKILDGWDLKTTP